MKKKVLFLFGCMTAITCTACGKVDKNIDNVKFSEYTVESISETHQNEEKKKQEVKMYDKDSGWKEISITEAPIQVEDTLYYAGLTVQEFLEKVDESEIEYTYDVNLNQPVQGISDDSIVIYRDGEEWFKAHYVNYMETAAEIKDLPIIGYSLANKEAYTCTRFIDGDITQEMILDVPEKSRFIIMETINRIMGLNTRTNAPERYGSYEGVYRSERCIWTNKYFNIYIYLSYEIDTDKNEFTEFCYTSGPKGLAGVSWKDYYVFPKKMEEVKDMDKVMEAMDTYAKGKDENAKLYGTYLVADYDYSVGKHVDLYCCYYDSNGNPFAACINYFSTDYYGNSKNMDVIKPSLYFSDYESFYSLIDDGIIEENIAG